MFEARMQAGVGILGCFWAVDHAGAFTLRLIIFDPMSLSYIFGWARRFL
jgi:hypothetical protein